MRLGTNALLVSVAVRVLYAPVCIPGPGSNVRQSDGMNYIHEAEDMNAAMHHTVHACTVITSR
jgi:hypothetical protein